MVFSAFIALILDGVFEKRKKNDMQMFVIMPILVVIYALRTPIRYVRVTYSQYGSEFPFGKVTWWKHWRFFAEAKRSKSKSFQPFVSTD